MKTDTIRQFPLFVNLPDEELARLAEMLPECIFNGGEIVLTEATISDHFFLLCGGEAEIVKALGTADERVVAVSKSGAMLGEMGMFSHDGCHTASVRALMPLTLLKITYEQFNGLLMRNPGLAYDLLRLYSLRLEHSESLTIQDLREKNRQLTLAYQELQAAQAALIEKEKLEHELQLASEIQLSILPEVLPDFPGWNFGGLMVPNRQVGGDFYDFIALDEHRIGIIVGDVCDKGMPAALFMMLIYSSVRIEAQRQASPGDTLRAVNRHLLEVNRSGMFVTLLYGILDCRTGIFSYARAGHPAPLLFDGSAQPVSVAVGLGQPVGLFDNSPLDEQSLQVPPGGTLLVFSDGLSETVEEIGGEPELPLYCSSLLDRNKGNAQIFCDHLWHTLGGATAESLIKDDFTVIAIKNINYL